MEGTKQTEELNETLRELGLLARKPTLSIEEQAISLLRDSGFPPPEEHKLGIPNSITQDELLKFSEVTFEIIQAPESSLRDCATFLASLCSSLIYERGLINTLLENARKARHEAVTEIIKSGLDKATYRL